MPNLSERPTVSVIVPNYNYAKTLGTCLESVYAQTYQPAEVIVVDDGSTDASPEIARAAGSTLIQQPRNRGAAAARNTGVAASTGEVLFFVDSDVALEPDAIANAVQLLREDPTCGCVYGIHPVQPLVDDGPVEHYRTLLMHSALMRARGYTTTMISALVAIPRAVFDEVGPFDERIHGAGGEDNEYSNRLSAGHRILLSDRVVGRHDDEDRLLRLLGEQYRRSQYVPYWARQRFHRGTLKVNSVPGVLAAAVTVGSLPLARVQRRLLAVPAASFAFFTVANPRLSRLVLREKGPRFLAFFTAVHFLVNLTIPAGVAAGYLRAAVDPSFGPVRRPSGERTPVNDADLPNTDDRPAAR